MSDIAQECEEHLGPAGFCAVQLMPVNELKKPTSPDNSRLTKTTLCHSLTTQGCEKSSQEKYPTLKNPTFDIFTDTCTYFRDDGYIAPFGPVGYGIGNFWGSSEDLEDMVLRCGEVGVTVLANVVLNHFFFDFGDTLSSLGNRIHHPGKIFNFDLMISQRPGAMDFPSWGLTADDFHPECNVDNVWQDETTLKECTPYGFDVKTESPRVQEKIIEHLSTLIEMGVAGFRVDISFAMWEEDLKAIIDQVPDISIGGRPFIVHELYNNKPYWTYTEFGRAIEDTYGKRLTQAIRTDKNLQLLGSESGLWKPQDDFPNQFSSDNALAFLDNHNSRYNKRLYFGDTKEERLEYKLGMAFMLASDFGVKRIFSTFFSRWRPLNDPDWNYPDPSLPFACGSETDFYDPSLKDTYVCQHRWEVVLALVTFANHVEGASVEKITSSPEAISFSRGAKGFFAMGSGLVGQQGETKYFSETFFLPRHL